MMKNFREFLLEQGPPPGPPGGLPGPPPGLGGPPPMGGGLPPLGGAPPMGGLPGMGPSPGAPLGGAPQAPPLKIKPIDVWDILERILEGKPAVPAKKEKKPVQPSSDMVQQQSMAGAGEGMPPAMTPPQGAAPPMPMQGMP